MTRFDEGRSDASETRPDGHMTADSSTYTRSQMERTLGREVQSEAVSRQREPGTHAADHVRSLVRALGENEPDKRDEVMEQFSMAILDAQEQERQRLAEELHDGPAQAFANAMFQSEILERAMREDPIAARDELVALRGLLERELDVLRGYINQLRPSLGEAAGLEDALRDGAAAVSDRSGLPVEVTMQAPADMLQESARVVVLRVAQEALRNIAKHSEASRAWIVTRVVPASEGSGKWLLEVGDDGRGFDIAVVTAQPNRRHFGLRFMRERAELLGSDLSISSIPAGGTVVRLAIDI